MSGLPTTATGLEAAIMARKGRRRRREIVFTAPCHEDRRPSARWNPDKQTWFCDPCGVGGGANDLAERLGLSTNGHTQADGIVSVYDYADEQGTLLFQVVRKAGKQFRQRRPDGDGGWIWNIQGVRRVLYRLPELLAADPARAVLIPEGEKDVDCLCAIGFVATTNPHGAGKWRAEYAEHLRGRDVAILPDNDESGWQHAQTVARSLAGVAASVRVVELPDLPAKGDVSAWLDNGGTPERLRELVEAAPLVGPNDVGAVGQVGGVGGVGPAVHQPATGDGARVPPTTWTADALLDLEIPPPKTVVPGLLVEGLALLCGKPKLGKSWLAMVLGIAIGYGGVALGTIAVEGGDVLYIAAEDTPRRLQSRLRKLLGDQTPPKRLTLATEWPRLDAGGLELLDQWLREHPGARLVIVDTLARVRPRRTRGGDLYDEDYAAGAMLKQIADRHGITILVVHHLRKLGAEDPLDMVSGTLGLTGAADGVLILKRDRGRHDAALLVTGRDLEEQELALKWDPLITWTVIGDAAEYRQSQERKAIVGVVAAQGKPIGPKAVAVALNKNESTTRWLMREMAKSGELRAVGDGLYTTPNTANTANPPTAGDSALCPGEPSSGDDRGTAPGPRGGTNCGGCGRMLDFGERDVGLCDDYPACSKAPRPGVGEGRAA